MLQFTAARRIIKEETCRYFTASLFPVNSNQKISVEIGSKCCYICSPSHRLFHVFISVLKRCFKKLLQLTRPISEKVILTNYLYYD